jgi:ABC-type lipoprotein release transport system permease subunit
MLIGLAGALALGPITRALLYGVAPFDPSALASAALAPLVFTAVAAALPARRATLLDPAMALRIE